MADLLQINSKSIDAHEGGGSSSSSVEGSVMGLGEGDESAR
jgi:hypothetical protein